MYQSRRDFVKAGATSLVCASALIESSNLFAPSRSSRSAATLLGSRSASERFRRHAQADRRPGFKEVESAGYYNHSAAEVKQAFPTQSQAGERPLSLRRAQ